MPDNYDSQTPDDWSEVGFAAKAKVSDTVLKVGTLQFKNPAIGTSDSRLLPQTMQGAQIVSKEIKGLTLDAGYANRINHRDSTNNQIMALNTGGRRGISIEGGAANNQSDDFRFLGGSYQVSKDLTATYYYSNLEDLYKQHTYNLVHVLPIG
ncbi:OprD family outer membrane porin, partial [Leclercia adecarboxylata]|uniref:OprD family outer membrane porin n=1 Tax=Leclercia adecarboxylata TaxID=83655 RepID=UPI00234C8905